MGAVGQVRIAKAALVVCVAIAFQLLTAGVASADDGLLATTEITFRPDIDEATVAVTATVDLTSVRANTYGATTYRTYWYEGFAFVIDNGYSDLVITESGRELSFEVEQPAEDESVSIVQVRLSRNLNYQQSQRLEVSYNLAGETPRSDSFIRVNPSVAIFPILLCCESTSLTVNIAVPPGYDLSLPFGADRFEEQTQDDGSTLFVATETEDPSFFVASAYVTSQSPHAYETARVETGNITALVRSWPGDDEWADFVTTTLETDLPVMQDLIGVDWPETNQLRIVQSVNPEVAGWGGWWDEGTIEVGEELDRELLLHELAHAWFDGDVFIGTWINEGLADELASRVIEASGEDLPTIDAPDAGYRDALALSMWTHPWRLETDEDHAREKYHYDASFWVMRSLTEEIGTDGLRQVLRAAALDEISFVGDVAPESFTGTDTWKRLLDLAEERGDATDFEAVLRDHVILPSHTTLLDDRADVHGEFRSVVDAGDEWAAPYGLRLALTRWQFTKSTNLIEHANQALVARDRVQDLADSLDLEIGDEHETAYEAASHRDDLTAVRDALIAEEAVLESIRDDRADALAALVEARSDVDEALSELDVSPIEWTDPAGPDDVEPMTTHAATVLEAAAHVADSTALVAQERSLTTRIGFWNQPHPDGDLERARSALSAGEPERVTAASNDARLVLAAAADRGRQRLVVASIAAATILVGVTIATLVRRRRRRAIATA